MNESPPRFPRSSPGRRLAGPRPPAFSTDGWSACSSVPGGRGALLPEDVRQDEFYWRRNPGSLHPRPHDHHLNNGGVCPAARGARGVQALPRHHTSRRLPHVADPSIERRERAAQSPRVRVRCRGARHHPKRERVAPDRPARDRLKPVTGADHDQMAMLHTTWSSGCAATIKLTRSTSGAAAEPAVSGDMFDRRSRRARSDPALPDHQPHRQISPRARSAAWPARAASRPSSRRDKPRDFRSSARPRSATTTAAASTVAHAPVGTGLPVRAAREHRGLWPMQQPRREPTHRSSRRFGRTRAANHNAIAEAGSSCAA